MEIIEQYYFNRNQIILIVAIMVYFWFLSYSTQPVPNVRNDTIMYGVDSDAPPTYVTGTQVGLGWLLVIFLVGSFKLKEMQKGRVSERKFKEFITKELKIKKEITLPNGKYELPPESTFSIDKDIQTTWEYTGGKKAISQYIVQVRINSDIGESYCLFIGDPVNLMIDDIIEIDEPLEYADKCPNCEGRFPNREVILESELEKYKKMKKALTSD